jgi:hypothetical protein
MKRTDLIAVGAASLLVADLFLRWEEGAGVHMRGLVDVGAGGSIGWSGWGAGAGICALVLIVLALAQQPLGPVTRAVLGVAMPVFAALALFAGDGHTGMHMSWVDVQAGDLRWPAWVGFGLAVVAALATVAPLLRRPAGRSRPHPV